MDVGLKWTHWRDAEQCQATLQSLSFAGKEPFFGAQRPKQATDLRLSISAAAKEGDPPKIQPNCSLLSLSQSESQSLLLSPLTPSTGSSDCSNYSAFVSCEEPVCEDIGPMASKSAKASPLVPGSVPVTDAGQPPGKSERIKECIQQSISDKVKKKITTIITEVEQLSDVEKLLLYLQLPNGSHQETDPLKHKGPGNPFGKKADLEVAQTYTWIQSHLEEDATVSLPKHEVYEEYKSFCEASGFEPLCVADFGKAMKHVFPRVKPRRLGQRGNSKYCYSGLRKKFLVEVPTLPALDTDVDGSPDAMSEVPVSAANGGEDTETKESGISEDTVFTASCHLVLEWAEKLVDAEFMTMTDLGRYLIQNEYVNNRSVAAITVISSDDRHHLQPSNSKQSSPKGASGSGRRDAQIQIQRKLHEKELIKEQKKKLLEQTKVTSPGPGLGKGASLCPRTGKKNRKPSGTKVGSESEQMRIESDPEVVIKKEHPEELEVNQLKSEPHLPVGHPVVTQNTRLLQNKVPIPRTGSTSHVATTISSIIVLPSLPQIRLAPEQSAIEASTSTIRTACQQSLSASPVKPIAPKYKRIQPKPIAVNRSCSAVESAFPSFVSGNEHDDCFGNSVKRRHSVSMPFTSESASAVPSDSTLSEKQQTKRHIDEKEAGSGSSKKRLLVDSREQVPTCPVNVNAVATFNLTHNNGEDTASSASLSPLSQTELISLTKSTSNLSNSDHNSGSQMVQELETVALLEYLHENGPNSGVPERTTEHWENSNKTAQLSQLRKLLEKNLPQGAKGLQSADAAQHQLQGFTELRQALLRKNLATSSAANAGHFQDSPANSGADFAGVTGSSFNQETRFAAPTRQMDSLVSSPGLDNHFRGSTIMKGPPFLFTDVKANPTLISGTTSQPLFANVQTQAPSVPASPNTRRRAFNFQPISPRTTPTVLDNNALSSVYGGGGGGGMIAHSPPQYQTNQHSVAVGPSQPVSAANSPFVSPRSTPVPLSRSRHNSGQSVYSTCTSRQTPFQNMDSGVSSISGSPFISPQSTPVPLSRVRSGSGVQRTIGTVNRARHSSGPGGPFSAVHHQVSRSTSLSPMISVNLEPNSGQTAAGLALALLESGSRRSTHNSGANTAICTPISPLSEPLSPNFLPNPGDNLNPLSESYLKLAFQENAASKEWANQMQMQMQMPSRPKMSGVYGLSRHRHLSSPYTLNSSSGDLYSQEKIPALGRNNGSSEFGDLSGLSPGVNCGGNRCQSVPVHQMKQIIQLNFNGQNDQLSSGGLRMGSSLLEEGLLVSTFSKSYPATPVCTQSFQFPASPPPSAIKLHNVITGDDISGTVLQSGQDVMVSGVQINEASAWSNSGASSHLNGENELMGNSSVNVRRNLNEMLAAPIEDDLQTTLEDLRDCDNDFSRFAQELEAMQEANGASEDLTSP